MDWRISQHIVPSYTAQGRAILNKAVDQLESVLYLQPDRHDAAYALAYCLSFHYEGFWKPKRAEKLLKNVFQSNPQGPLAGPALDQLALIYYDHHTCKATPENTIKAIPLLEFALKKMPGDKRDRRWARNLQLLKDAYVQQKDFHSMAETTAWAASLAENPNTEHSRYLIGNICGMSSILVGTLTTDASLKAEAKSRLLRWAEGQQPKLRYSASRTLAMMARENTNEAVKWYQQAADAYTNSKDPNLLDSRHWALLEAARLLRRADNANDALVLLKSFTPVKLRGRSTFINHGFEIGKCLEELGREQESLETYLKYLDHTEYSVDHDILKRVENLGGVPLRKDRDINVRYCLNATGHPIRCRTLATDGRRLFINGKSGHQPSQSRYDISALDLQTRKWQLLGGPESGTLCLACDEGMLWAGTYDQGLWRYDLANNQWRQWNTESGLPDDHVIDILLHEGAAFVSVGDKNSGGVVRIDKNNQVHVYETENSPRGAFSHLAIDNGILYAGLRHRLDLKSNQWKRITSAESREPYYARYYFKGPSGLWGSSGHHEAFRYGTSIEENELYRKAWTPEDRRNSGYKVRFMFEYDGKLWFGGTPWARYKSVGFYRLDTRTGDFVIYGIPDGFRSSVSYSCYDGLLIGNTIWLATEVGLAEVTIRKPSLIPTAVESSK